jgi:hypothetical protein
MGERQKESVFSIYLVITYINSKYFFPSSNHPFLNSMTYTVETTEQQGRGVCILLTKDGCIPKFWTLHDAYEVNLQLDT